MMNAIRQWVTVQAGGRIEFVSPELRPGSHAEVIVLPDAVSNNPAPPSEPTPDEIALPLAGFIGSGKGCFTGAAEVDAFIRNERDAWER